MRHATLGLDVRSKVAPRSKFVLPTKEFLKPLSCKHTEAKFKTKPSLFSPAKEVPPCQKKKGRRDPGYGYAGKKLGWFLPHVEGDRQ